MCDIHVTNWKNFIMKINSVIYVSKIDNLYSSVLKKYVWWCRYNYSDNLIDLVQLDLHFTCVFGDTKHKINVQ